MNAADKNMEKDRNAIINVVIEDTKSWIRKNYKNKITSSSASARSGYTKWYFQRKFKQTTGRSLTSFIRLVKAEKAVIDIIKTHAPLSDIAERNGFSSLLSMSRAIKEHYQMTPSQFRDVLINGKQVSN